MITPITKERLIKIKEWRELYGAGSNVVLPAEEAEELARIALAAMGAESVAFINDAWTLVYYRPPEKFGLKIGDKLYAAPPAPVVPEIDRKAIADRVYGKCCRIPGATFYNAAEFALDEVDACRAEILKNCASVKPSTDAGCVTNNPSNCASVKDHQIRELVNELRDIAVECHGTQQLREQIARTVRSAILRPRGEVAPLLDSEDKNTDSVPGGNERVSQPYKLPEEKGASLQLRNLIRKRHAEWSDSTFGNVGPVGSLKHLSKEALKAAAEPDDLSEWADMQFLLWDAQRRAGISDGEITSAMEEKLKVNMARHWPEPKDGEPRMHIKEPGNSPVIPDGWQLVPVKPTPEMGRAALFKNTNAAVWKAMLAAAPQQEVK